MAKTQVELMSIAEIAELGGVSRQRAQQWTKQDGFPKPVQRLRAVTIYAKPDVQAWLEHRSRRPIRDA